MALHVYTQEEFDEIPRDEDGMKNCPTGDYTQIHKFPHMCIFGPKSRFGAKSYFGAWSFFGDESYFGKASFFGTKSCFGKWSTFEKWSIFGSWSRFGDCSNFGDGAIFGERAIFGKDARFGRQSRFGNWSHFGDGAIFGEMATFGAWGRFEKDARFGENSDFGDGTIFEDGANFEGGKVGGQKVRMLKIDLIGSRRGATYFWQHDGGIYVRCGCVAGDIDTFSEKVEKTHAENQQYLEEYRGAIQYAKTVFGVEETS